MKNVIERKCKMCGKVTKHYLTKDDHYKCMICGSINGEAHPKEIKFTSNFDDELNED